MATSSSVAVYEVRSFIRGFHEYQHIWTPSIGEVNVLKREPTNPFDSYAVAVRKDNETVGHLPYNMAPTVSAFLSRDTNVGFAEVTGARVNRGGGYGLEIPCIYRFYGPQLYIDHLETILRENPDARQFHQSS